MSECGVVLYDCYGLVLCECSGVVLYGCCGVLLYECCGVLLDECCYVVLYDCYSVVLCKCCGVVLYECCGCPKIPGTAVSIQQGNPKNSGTKAHECFEKYKGAETIGGALSKGANWQDLSGEKGSSGRHT